MFLKTTASSPMAFEDFTIPSFGPNFGDGVAFFGDEEAALFEMGE
jgi:hypothetical protein